MKDLILVGIAALGLMLVAACSGQSNTSVAPGVSTATAASTPTATVVTQELVSTATVLPEETAVRLPTENNAAVVPQQTHTLVVSEPVPTETVSPTEVAGSLLPEQRSIFDLKYAYIQEMLDAAASTSDEGVWCVSDEYDPHRTGWRSVSYPYRVGPVWLIEQNERLSEERGELSPPQVYVPCRAFDWGNLVYRPNVNSHMCVGLDPYAGQAMQMELTTTDPEGGNKVGVVRYIVIPTYAPEDGVVNTGFTVDFFNEIPTANTEFHYKIVENNVVLAEQSFSGVGPNEWGLELNEISDQMGCTR